MKEIRYAIYARESDKEDNESQTIDNQINMIRKYISERSKSEDDIFYGFKEVDIFSEKASGGNMNRPKFLEMINKAKMKEFTYIFVTDQDRLSRTQQHFYQIYEDLITKNKLHIYLINMGKELDLETLEGLIIHGQKSFFDMFYRRQISDKVKKVYAYKKKKAKERGESVIWGPKKLSESNSDLVCMLKDIIKENPEIGYRSIRNKLGKVQFRIKDKNGEIIRTTTRMVALGTIYNLCKEHGLK